MDSWGSLDAPKGLPIPLSAASPDKSCLSISGQIDLLQAEELQAPPSRPPGRQPLEDKLPIEHCPRQ